MHDLEKEAALHKIEREKEEKIIAKLKKAIWIKKYVDTFGVNPPNELLEVVMSMVVKGFVLFSTLASINFR